MRILLVGAAADSSIRDVEYGWHQALLRAGHDVRPYNLNNRIKLYSKWMGISMQGIDCPSCDTTLLEPDGIFADQVTIYQAASECVIHEALRWPKRAEGDTGWPAPWAQMAVIISGCSFHSNAAAFLNQIRVPVVLVHTEAPYNDEDIADLARVCAIVGTNERRSVPHFAAHAGEAALYLPTAYDRERHTPGPPEAGKQCDVFFVGTGFDERARLFAETDWSGIDFRLAGFWPTGEDGEVIPTAQEARLGQVKIGHDARLAPFVTRGLIDNAETVRWYRSARIVLAAHRDDGRGESIGPRVYEAAACGAFQIADDSRQELTDIFGESIPTYRAGDPEHLAWTVRYWLARPEQRRRLAEYARRLVAPHSYDDRLSALMALIARLKRAA